MDHHQLLIFQSSADGAGWIKRSLGIQCASAGVCKSEDLFSYYSVLSIMPCSSEIIRVLVLFDCDK